MTKSKILLYALSFVLLCSCNVFALVVGGVYYIGTSNRVMTGSINVTGANTDVPGTGTAFLTELGVGADILVSGETREIATITNNTTATVTSAWGSDLADDLTPEVIPEYATVTAFEADIGTPLTSNLTGKHLDEETAISTVVTFDTDTATFLLKLTAAEGAKHNGTFGSETWASGDGARVNFAGSDAIRFDETTNGDLADVELSDLVIDMRGNGNTGIWFNDCGDNGDSSALRNIVRGDGDSSEGISISNVCTNASVYNNIVYGVGNGSSDDGILLQNVGSGDVIDVSNNTCVKNFNNFRYNAASLGGTLTFKNNIAQGDIGGSDYADGGGGYGTADENVSEDTTKPGTNGAASTDMHTTNDVFLGYATDDYRLDSDGNATNLDILDDGVDLSGIFPDDVQDQTRDTWYIGASEILAVGGPVDFEPRIIWFSQYMNKLIEQCYMYN